MFVALVHHAQHSKASKGGKAEHLRCENDSSLFPINQIA